MLSLKSNATPRWRWKALCNDLPRNMTEQSDLVKLLEWLSFRSKSMNKLGDVDGLGA